MFFIDTIYRMASVFIPSIIVQRIMIKNMKDKDIKKKDIIWRYIFLLYLFMAISLAATGTIWDIGKYGNEIIRLDEIVLIPFNSEGLTTYLLNVIMFMPLGFLLPYIWDNFRNLKSVIFTSFIFSLSIELSQLLNRRTTDIDDLTMNTLGGLLGYIIWKLFFYIFKIGNKNISLSKYEPIIYIFTALLGRFFLYNWHLWVKLVY